MLQLNLFFFRKMKKKGRGLLITEGRGKVGMVWEGDWIQETIAVKVSAGSRKSLVPGIMETSLNSFRGTDGLLYPSPSRDNY
jgi:hypothetical protein